METSEINSRIESKIEWHEDRIESLRRSWPEFDSDVDYHNRKIIELRNSIIEEDMPF